MLLRVKNCELMTWLAAGGRIIPALVVSIALITGSPARAQETRTEEVAKKQAEKAQEAKPYQPTRFEAIMTRLEESFTSPPSGFYPAFGSIYPGGGFTLGAGYRRFYARNAVWNLFGLYSLRNYKQIEVNTHTPWTLDGRWVLGVRAGWRDAPQVGYYGLGNESEQDDRANFRVSQGYGGANLEFHPTRWTQLAADVAYEDFENQEGQGSAPSIETIYDPLTAPGLFSNPTYIHTQANAAIDWRSSPGYSRKGGYYGLTLHDYYDRDETFSFRRLDGELIQHLPLLRETWVLSVRGRVQTTVDDDDVVPYYMLPMLGSGSTLRAYSTGRFRDRHTLLTSAEFRWIPSRLALDMAIFYDAGKVAARREDLDFNDLQTDWGIGARFHAARSTVLRIEMARGSEGWNLVFATSAAF
jgi:hypothetical protein